MKKALIVPVLLFLLAACTPPEPEDDRLGGIPLYRVWASWEEMKEVLGDHYLYPTYLPEATERSENPLLQSRHTRGGRERDADELFFGYFALFPGADRMGDEITIQAVDFERRNTVAPLSPILLLYVPFDARFQVEDRFNEHTVTIGGVDIEFVSFYADFSPDEHHPNPDEWFRCNPRNGRAVLYIFTIDTVTYRMSWIQNNVEGKYADDEQREGMLRVARSIIEQVKEQVKEIE